jgi:hypothetical protein
MRHKINTIFQFAMNKIIYRIVHCRFYTPPNQMLIIVTHFFRQYSKTYKKSFFHQ